MRLLTDKYRPNACSATVATLAAGHLVTLMPRFLQASRSTQSVPAPIIAIIRRSGVRDEERTEASRRATVVTIIVAERTRDAVSEGKVRW